jgi:hypothetical protein
MSELNEVGFVVNLGEKVSPVKLAAIFGVNVSLLYQDHQKGKFGPKALVEQTYIEAIQNYRTALVKGETLKREKMERELELQKEKIEQQKQLKERKLQGTDTENNLLGLQELQIKQRIKTDRVKEIETWLKIAQTRGELLISYELQKLYEPFLLLIKNGLISITMDFPETRTKIDEILNGWAAFGKRLLEQTEIDNKDFVEEMSNKNVEDKLIELQFLPESRDI